MYKAEKIKNKEITEVLFFPFDAGLVGLLSKLDMNFLYVPKILSTKESDANFPE